jgi:hypothetical protein
MTCFRIYGDAAGDTHLQPIELPAKETFAGTVRGINDIPATTAGMAAFLDRKPDTGVHEAPCRQFVVVLEGELEIITNLGHEERLGPGDVLLADDVGSKGHISRDVGEQPLMLMTVGIGDDWSGPPD